MGTVDLLLPRSRLGKAILLAALGLALLHTLGTLGARLGPVVFRPLDWRWFLVPAALALLSPVSTSIRPAPARQAAAALALVLSGWLVSSWLEALGRTTSSLQASIGRLSGEAEGASVELTSLRLPGRKYLNRLAGRRRDVALAAAGALRAPESGTYRFELDCDDRCTLSLDGRPLVDAWGRTSATVELAEGLHRFELRYEQAGGPATLEVAWNRPALFEPLGLEHYVAADTGALSPQRLRKKSWAATAVAGAVLLWWSLALGLVVRAGELRREWIRFFTLHPAGRFAPVLAGAAIVLFGAALRLRALEARAGFEPTEWLDPIFPDYGAFDPPEDPSTVYRADVRSYLERSEQLSWRGFYEPHFREPFYVVLVQAFLALAGGREVGILLQSTFFSILTLPLVFWLAWRGVGRFPALAVLLPLALHEWIVTEAPTGYRVSTYSFFLVAFAGWVFSGARERHAARAAVAGLLAAMICLIRLSGLSLVLPLLGLAAWEQRKNRGLSYAAIALFVLGLGIGPFLWNSYRAHGDPFYSVSFHTRYWLEAETPGEVAPRVTVYRYLFEFLGTEKLVSGMVRGLTVLPLRTFWRGLAHFPLLDAAVVGLGVAGLVWCLVRGPRFIPVAYFGHLVPFAYLQNFPSGEMPRFVIPAFFFLMMGAGHALEKWARRRSLI